MAIVELTNVTLYDWPIFAIVVFTKSLASIAISFHYSGVIEA